MLLKNRNYAKKDYNVLSQSCVQAGKVISEANGDSFELSTEAACHWIKGLHGKINGSGDLHVFRCGLNVLKAAYFDRI